MEKVDEDQVDALNLRKSLIIFEILNHLNENRWFNKKFDSQAASPAREEEAEEDTTI